MYEAKTRRAYTSSNGIGSRGLPQACQTALGELAKQIPFFWNSRAPYEADSIDHARGLMREKRGGAKAPVPVDEALVFSPVHSAELIRLDEALERLAEFDGRQNKNGELRFYGRRNPCWIRASSKFLAINALSNSG